MLSDLSMDTSQTVKKVAEWILCRVIDYASDSLPGYSKIVVSNVSPKSNKIEITTTLNHLEKLVYDNQNWHRGDKKLFLDRGLKLLKLLGSIEQKTTKGSDKRKIVIFLNVPERDASDSDKNNVLRFFRDRWQEEKNLNSHREKIDKTQPISISNSSANSDRNSMIMPMSMPVPVPIVPHRVYQPDYWVDRDSLSQQLFEKIIHDNCRILLLFGISGIGKTAQAERLIEELRQENQWIEIRLNFEDNKQCSFSSFAISFLEKVGIQLTVSEASPEALLTSVVAQLTKNSCLVLLDSAEYLLTRSETRGWGDFKDGLWGELLTQLLSAENCQSRVIITSQDNLSRLTIDGDRYRQLWHLQVIGGWNESQQVEFFRRHDGKITLEYDNLTLDSINHPLRVIGRVYGGHPLLLQVICGEIIETYHGSVNAYWQEYGSQIETVRKDIETALQSQTEMGSQHRWHLHDYTTNLQRHINARLGVTIERLKNDSELAYLLLCYGSNYSISVAEKSWIRHLLLSGYSENIGRNALEILQNRYLVQSQIKLVDVTDEMRNIRSIEQIHLSLHNLIRSIAIDHRVKLELLKL
jgi:hypothetical protein